MFPVASFLTKTSWFRAESGHWNSGFNHRYLERGHGPWGSSIYTYVLYIICMYIYNIIYTSAYYVDLYCICMYKYIHIYIYIYIINYIYSSISLCFLNGIARYACHARLKDMSSQSCNFCARHVFWQRIHVITLWYRYTVHSIYIYITI